MVFYPNSVEVFARMKEILSEFDLDGVAPLDNQLDLEGIPPGEPLMEKIYMADESLLRSVDGATFCLDPFRRGTEMDPGTAFEIGFMNARMLYCAETLPMCGWTTQPASYPEKVRTYSKTVFGEDLAEGHPNAAGASSGSLRDPDGMMVHSTGLVQNAMVVMGIKKRGGIVAADPDWQIAFRLAAEHLARMFTTLAQTRGAHPGQ
jgi:nucleoside 2-deoxyribosyltransferase